MVHAEVEISADLHIGWTQSIPDGQGRFKYSSILFGKSCPSGRLPYTYPKFPNSLITYDYKPSENQEKMEGVYDYMSDQSVQYSFGYGLSYTSFTYSKLHVQQTVFAAKDSLEVFVDVKNIGDREAKETVLFFVSDVLASITPDNRRLRAFEKINLKAGETKTVKVSIAASDLAFVNKDNEWELEPGEFKIQVGDQMILVEAKEGFKWKFRN